MMTQNRVMMTAKISQLSAVKQIKEHEVLEKAIIIKENEIRNACSELKNGKAGGKDGLKNEHSKYMGQIATNALCTGIVTYTYFVTALEDGEYRTSLLGHNSSQHTRQIGSKIYMSPEQVSTYTIWKMLVSCSLCRLLMPLASIFGS